MRRILSSLVLFFLLSAGLIARAEDVYSYAYSGAGIAGSGTFTLNDTANEGVYEVVSMTGQVNGTGITGLLPVGTYNDNDNLFYGVDPYLDESGVGFLLANGANVRIFYVNGDWFFQGDGNFVLDGGEANSLALAFGTNGQPVGTLLQLDSFTFGTEVAEAPEPSSLVLLGTGVIGVAGFARRRFVRM